MNLEFRILNLESWILNLELVTPRSKPQYKNQSTTQKCNVTYWWKMHAILHKLQKLQNRANRIITNSSFDTPSRPIIAELGWQTIEELIDNESKIKVFKSLNDLAPQYLCNLFTKNSACSSHNLRNTETDLRS